MDNRAWTGGVGVVPAAGWTPDTLPSISPLGAGSPLLRVAHVALRSPRGGTFTLYAIALPVEMGSFDAAGLSALMKRSATARERMGCTSTDQTSWTQGELMFAGTSFVPDAVSYASSPKRAERSENATRRKRERWLSTFRRDWYIGRGTDLVNAWYESTAGPDTVHDVAECEAMVRSISFERRV